MFIILLLITQVSCDWVEISQNHYRKEPIHHVNFEQTTKSYAMYRNSSLTERLWHKGAVDRVSNVANIRKVQHPSVKTNSFNIRNAGHNNNFNDHTDTMETYNFISTKPHTQDSYLENNNKANATRTTANYDDQMKRPNLKHVKHLPTEASVIDVRKQYSENKHENDVIHTNQGKRDHISTPSSTSKQDFDENKRFSIIGKPNIRRDSIEDDINFSILIPSENRNWNNPVKVGTISQKNKINKENNEFRETFSTNYIKQIKNKPLETNLHSYEDLDSKNEFKNLTDYKGKNSYKSYESNTDKPIQNNVIESTTPMQDKDTKFSDTEHSRPKEILKVASNSKEMPIKGVWKLIKVVADTIYKNTHRSFKSKINYLESLKTTILSSIEDQVDRAWPDDVHAGATRRSRAAEPRGHVDFPSSESTLMTISFLTFAVFLIKLVLQVIHTYKNKTMMVTPAVVAAVGRAAAAIRTPT